MLALAPLLALALPAAAAVDRVTKRKASRAEIREQLAQQPRKEPDRTITRLQATRHLIHAAIRMTFWEEDPFAVHLTVSSANRVLTDLATANGVTLEFDWNSRLKDEYKQLGFAILSETYNFLRHADETPDEVHGVRNIVQRNDLDILMASKRFKEIAGHSTQHMTSFSHLMLSQYPKVFRDFDPPTDVPIKQMQLAAASLSRQEILRAWRMLFKNDPALVGERKVDLIDLGEIDPL
jgi:hypothetical protein